MSPRPDPAEQAQAFHAWCTNHPALPGGWAVITATIIADPRSTSDTLLILADAITELANHGRLHLTGTDTSRIDALDAVSAHLSTLAPTRAG